LFVCISFYSKKITKSTSQFSTSEKWQPYSYCIMHGLNSEPWSWSHSSATYHVHAPAPVIRSLSVTIAHFYHW